MINCSSAAVMLLIAIYHAHRGCLESNPYTSHTDTHVIVFIGIYITIEVNFASTTKQIEDDLSTILCSGGYKKRSI